MRNPLISLLTLFCGTEQPSVKIQNCYTGEVHEIAVASILSILVHPGTESQPAYSEIRYKVGNNGACITTNSNAADIVAKFQAEVPYARNLPTTGGREIWFDAAYTSVRTGLDADKPEILTSYPSVHVQIPLIMERVRMQLGMDDFVPLVYNYGGPQNWYRGLFLKESLTAGPKNQGPNTTVLHNGGRMWVHEDSQPEIAHLLAQEERAPALAP